MRQRAPPAGGALTDWIYRGWAWSTGGWLWEHRNATVPRKNETTVEAGCPSGPIVNHCCCCITEAMPVNGLGRHET